MTDGADEPLYKLEICRKPNVCLRRARGPIHRSRPGTADGCQRHQDSRAVGAADLGRGRVVATWWNGHDNFARRIYRAARAASVARDRHDLFAARGPGGLGSDGRAGVAAARLRLLAGPLPSLAGHDRAAATDADRPGGPDRGLGDEGRLPAALAAERPRHQLRTTSVCPGNFA